MNLHGSHTRVLDPLERFSEIVFGLIMVLSFTCALSVTGEREDVRAMLIGAIGCNLAWGIVDAAFYLIACLTEKGHESMLLRRVQESNDEARAQEAIRAAVPEKIAEALAPADFDRIRSHLKGLPASTKRPRLTAENYRGALGVFLLVFLSTFPVVVPFILVQDAQLALRLSNGVAMILLFAAGHMLGAYAGLRRIATGFAMVGIGIVLVAVTIVLGG